MADADAADNDVVTTISVNSGTLTLTTSAANGLTAGDISNNGTNSLVATGALNASLATDPALTYQSDLNFVGTDKLTITINDQGHTGSGGALTDSASFDIMVNGLSIDKTVSPTAIISGSTVTYTITLSNSGSTNAANTTLTDTLPVSTTFAQWLIQPNGTIRSGDAITWTGTVTTSEAITLSFVVTHTGTANETIANTAYYSHTTSSNSKITTFTTSSTQQTQTYLPIILKNQ